MARETRKPASYEDRSVLRRRLGLLALENVSKRNNAAVRRVLELLSEESLTTAAAKASGIDQFVLECGVLENAWEDSRVVNRVNQLERQNIKVERQTVVTRYGESEFTRERLIITF